MTKNLSKTPVRYHLRATLTPKHHAAEFKALLRIIKTAAIDEVVFFVPHAEERSPGLGTDAENAAMAKLLGPVFAKLRRLGITPSINIWWTTGFSAFPGLQRDLRKRFAFRWAVRLDGTPSTSIACPRCPEWRAQIKRMYQTFAKLKPARIWIDDDVRMTMRADLHSPCVCADCLAELSRNSGKTITRENFACSVMADPPNQVRNAWLDCQDKLHGEIVAMLADAVHEASPSTETAIMVSSPESHGSEGRKWNKLFEALKTKTPYIRPFLAQYADANGIGCAEPFHSARIIQAIAPAGAVLAPEIENYPQSRFTKSAALVKNGMQLAQLAGMREVTFSIYRFGGRLDLETSHEQIWEATLGSLKPRLQAIANLGISSNEQRGVSLVWNEECARQASGVGQEKHPGALNRQRPWDTALPLLGIATQYAMGGVSAIAGEQAACLSPEELKQRFAQGVLLDASAADILIKRGLGHMAGIAERLADIPAVLEHITDAKFGLKGDLINLRWLSPAWQFRLLPGAREISQIETGHASGEHMPGLVLYENTGGGRCAILPWNGMQGMASAIGMASPPFLSASMLNWQRQIQLRHVLEWLGQKPLPLFIPNTPCAYPLLAGQGKRLVVGVANFHADPIENLTLMLRCPEFPIKQAKVLDEKGKWRKCAAKFKKCGRERLVVETSLALQYLDVAALILEGGDSA